MLELYKCEGSRHIAKLTTGLINAPLIAKLLSELQRSRQAHPKQLVAATITGLENNRLAEFDDRWNLM